jgi:hypothetical protein
MQYSAVQYSAVQSVQSVQYSALQYSSVTIMFMFMFM